MVYQVRREFSLFDRNQLRFLFLIALALLVFAVLFGVTVVSRDPHAVIVYLPFSVAFAWTL